MGQDRVGPSSKIWASRNNSGLGRINGSGLARAVGVYGRLRDLREPEVPGRANDGATTATDVVLEREHQSGRAVCVDACESLFSIAPESGPLRGRASHAQNEAVKEFPSGLAHAPSIFVRKWDEEQVHRLAVMEPLLPFVELAVPSCFPWHRRGVAAEVRARVVVRWTACHDIEQRGRPGVGVTDGKVGSHR